MKTAVGALLLVAFSGCTDLDDAFQFGGTFTREATQADIEDFRSRMERYGASDINVLESFPMQFQVLGLGDDCQHAVDEAAGLIYVDHVTPCRQTTTGSDADRPTSTGTSASVGTRETL